MNTSTAGRPERTILQQRGADFEPHVGAGLAADTVRRVMPRLKKADNNANPFAVDASPHKECNMHWARTDLVAAIEFARWTAPAWCAKLLKGLREDKPADEVKVEKR